MKSENHMAFKEWAAVCLALNAGRQTLILRKGGIHEGREGFQVTHAEFWLFPTYVHEARDGLIPEAADLLAQAERDRPPPGELHLSNYMQVTDVYEIHATNNDPSDERPLVELTGRHVWSPTTVAQRYAYRRPGISVICGRVYRRPQPIVLPDSPHFAGCRSWVELPGPLETAGLEPVLSDEAYAAEMAAIQRILGGAQA